MSQIYGTWLLKSPMECSSPYFSEKHVKNKTWKAALQVPFVSIDF
jgi:hypothetical protein